MCPNYTNMPYTGSANIRYISNTKRWYEFYNPRDRNLFIKSLKILRCP